MSSSQPSSESPSASDERGTSQQEQRKGKESALINEKPTAESHDNGKLKLERRQWEDLITKSYSEPARSPFVVSIFRVPNFLKGSKTAESDSYAPKRVSLGPYHYDTSKELRLVDRHKGKALCQMNKRFNHVRSVTDHPNNREFCHCAVKEIEKLEKAIRDSYEETIECDGETLALMLSLDGSFVLEILRTLEGDSDKSREPSKGYEPIFEFEKIDNTGLDILNDILKLENQIPWIVLQKLLQLELNSTENDARKKLQQLIVGDGILSKICPFDLKKYQLSEQSPRLPEEADHLLGFLHSFIAPPHDRLKSTLHRDKVPGEKDQDQSIMVEEDDQAIMVEEDDQSIMVEEDDQRMDNLPRAVELSDAGIKFESCTSIWEIKFDPVRATIYLPRISISDHTEVLFRNLIAFEKCKPCKTNYVADYVYLMDRLIDSEKDVSLLRRMGIVENMLGSDKEVAELFNDLCKGVTVGVVFKELILNVIQHYGNKWKVQFAQFLEKYLSSPWKALALVGAIFGLLSSAAQTIILIIMLQK